MVWALGSPLLGWAEDVWDVQNLNSPVYQRDGESLNLHTQIQFLVTPSNRIEEYLHLKFIRSVNLYEPEIRGPVCRTG